MFLLLNSCLNNWLNLVQSPATTTIHCTNLNDLSLFSLSAFCLCLWLAPQASRSNQRKEIWIKNNCIYSELGGNPRMFCYGNVLFLLIIPAVAEYEGIPIKNQTHFRVRCTQIQYTSNCVLNTLVFFSPDSWYQFLLVELLLLYLHFVLLNKNMCTNRKWKIKMSRKIKD